MKAPLLLPLLLLTSCTIHIGGQQHESPDAKRVEQLIQSIPDHGMSNATRNEFTPEYYDLLTQAWAIPSDAVEGIGSEEWLYYFVSGNGESSIKTIVGEITNSYDTVTANFDLLFAIGEDECDTVPHTLTLLHNGEKWVIYDVDDTKFQLENYIKEQRAHLRSQEWLDYLQYERAEFEGADSLVEEKKKEVERYFIQYPD